MKNKNPLNTSESFDIVFIYPIIMFILFMLVAPYACN